ncbi:MAG TPA: hypothetical protein VG317_02995 [Pseudonocardiaceae bacterium]|jgi:hypothetical protein|nr:hypothetical protein [Pseudonocardiaceae bacterium]
MSTDELSNPVNSPPLRSPESPGAESPTDQPAGPRCGLCGRPVPTDERWVALVPDSSVIHPDDASQDGHRRATSCGSAHLEILIDRARRGWISEQLWFGRLRRASTESNMADATVLQVGIQARLSPENLYRALAWNSRQDNPDTTLPGGHRLPD